MLYARLLLSFQPFPSFFVASCMMLLIRLLIKFLSTALPIFFFVTMPKFNFLSSLSDSFLNSLEIAAFDLNNKSITYNINQHESTQDLEYFFSQDGNSNKIFIGPLTSEETKVAKNHCNKNIIEFSFASE